MFQVMTYLTIALSAAQIPNQKERNSDAALIQGTWEIIAAEKDGMPVRDFVTSRIEFKGNVVKGSFFNIPRGYPAKTAESRFRLDPATSPKSLDWIINNREFKAGVYSLQNHELKICINRSLTERPTALKTRIGDNRTVYVLRRISSNGE